MPILQEWCRKHPKIALYLGGVGLLTLGAALGGTLAIAMGVAGVGAIALAVVLALASME